MLLKPYEIDENSASTWLYDGMAVLQNLSSESILETMAELAKLIFVLVMKYSCNNLRVDFICNRYPNVSIIIKSAERNKRALVGGMHTRILSGNQTCPKQMKSIRR